MKVHPGEEVDLIDLRGGKNKGDITNSRKFLAEFLVNSLGSYQRAMQIGMEDLENGNVTKKELLQEIKTDMQSFISGMLKDVPEDSPNRAIISKTAEILSNDKAMDEYITKMDNSITKEKNRILGNKHEKERITQEAFDEHGYADKEDLNRLALRNAVVNSPFAKASEEISKNEKNESGNFWKKAAEFLN
jgi:hypothetical protein